MKHTYTTSNKEEISMELTNLEQAAFLHQLQGAIERDEDVYDLVYGAFDARTFPPGHPFWFMAMDVLRQYDEPGEMLTVTQLAEIYDITPSPIRNAINRGELRAEKINNIHQIAINDAAQWQPGRSKQNPWGESVRAIIGKVENDKGAMEMRLTHDGIISSITQLSSGSECVEFDKFSRFVLYTEGIQGARLIEYEPSNEQGHVKFGPFAVNGQFVERRRFNNDGDARYMWQFYEQKQSGYMR